MPSVKPGALVVALGADGPGKRELGPAVLRGDVKLLVDSRKLCGGALGRPLPARGLPDRRTRRAQVGGRAPRATPRP